MANRQTLPRVKLAVESLETREVPSGSGLGASGFLESFDKTPIAGLPTHWASYNTRGASFEVSTRESLGSGAGLTTDSDTSDGSARVWQNQFQAANVQASVAVHLDSLEPAQLFVRGKNLHGEKPTYYAVSVTRGLDVQLLKVVDGKQTTLKTISSDNYHSDGWIRLSLVARGDQLVVQVFRTDTAQYLASDGTWGATPVEAMSVKDASITTAGLVGLNRPAKYAGSVSYDNFAATNQLSTGTVRVIHDDAFKSGANGQPQGWSTWTNGGTVEVNDDRTLSGTGSLIASGPSHSAVRTWLNTTIPTDAQVSTAVYLDSLAPAQLFARGQDLSSNSPSYYGVNVIRGLQAQLVRVIDGQTTVLGTVSSKDYFSSKWVQVTFSLQGDKLRVQLYRTDTAQYLNANGTWQVAQAWAIERTDKSIAREGRVGLGRPANFSGAVTFDNFVITTVPTTPSQNGGGTTGGNTGGTTTPTTQTYTWDKVPLGMQPSGWTQWSNNFSAGFHVSAVESLSRPSALVGTGGANTTTRLWLNNAQPADVRVGGAVYVDSLVPAQVIARGKDLSTDRPDYYAVQVVRGLEVQIVRVIDGVTTVLGTLKSKAYLSGEWVRISLITHGSTLQAVVQRTDTNQYLQADGSWGASQTVALERTDTLLKAGGSVGIGRPGKVNGRILVDDFTVTTGNVKLASPKPGTGGNTGGNTGGSTGGGTTTPKPPTPTPTPTPPRPETPLPSGMPNIPRHYNWIRIAQLAYSGTPLTAFEQKLLRESVDLIVPNIRYLDKFAEHAPNTPKMIYSNVSNIYLSLLTDWLSWADRNGVSREDAFYHAKVPTAWNGSSASSVPVNYFWAVHQNTGTDYDDRTTLVRNPGLSFALGGVGSTMSLGFTDRFREVNVTVSSPASGGFKGVWEYVSAVDAQGRPTAWKTLYVNSDSTANWKRSGQITFDPPKDWVASSQNGSPSLMYVRFRTTNGGHGPVVRSILGRDYVNARGGNSGTIPVFDKSADRDGDGYLNDAEWARRKAGHDARFLSESRMFYPVYGQMRFATNVADTDFRRWVVDYHFRYLQANPKAGGILMDNTRTTSVFTADQVHETTLNYGENFAASIQAINAKIAPRWVLANTAGVSTSFDLLPSKGISYMEEFAIRPMAHNWTQLEHLTSAIARRNQLSKGVAYSIIDSYPSNGTPTDPRMQIGTLAYYYLMADPRKTFLMFNGGFEPSTTWTRHWSDAVKFNVGNPTEDMSIFATGKDPTNAKLEYKIYQREYENALVLFKPIAYKMGQGQGTLADNTATTHNLNGTYRVLRADGTLGPATTRVSLRNGEGAVLVKA